MHTIVADRHAIFLVPALSRRKEKIICPCNFLRPLSRATTHPKFCPIRGTALPRVPLSFEKGKGQTIATRNDALKYS